MGKNVSSVVKLQGNVDGLSYYERDGKQFVRRAPKSNKTKFESADSMARVRENASEFKTVVDSAKRLWDTLRPLTAKNKDSRSFQRLGVIMNDLKKLDITSPRGKRDPMAALGVASGKALLKGFNFNSKAQLDSILFKPYTVDTTAGTLLIDGFNPLVHLSAEPSATHFTMRLCKADIDISTGKSELVVSNEAQFAVTSPAVNITLQLEAATTLHGLQLFVLQICFLQEMNGQLYPLKDKAHNASKIIEVL